MAACSICLEEIGIPWVILNCSHCEEAFHKTCIEQHLMHSRQEEAFCAKCSHLWSFDFLTLHFSSHWRHKVYNKHREEILLDREQALLPDAQDEALRLNRQQEIVDSYKKAKLETRRAARRGENLQQFEEVERILREELNRGRGHAAILGPNRPPQAIGTCPADGCRGFLSTDWKCKMCSLQVCSNCGEIQELDHSCNLDTVKSFQLITRETKRCPNCTVPITKISGCDHMFCTDCKVAFSWTTMEIHREGNSNPLYWQWRQQQQVQLQDACGTPAERLQELWLVSPRIYERWIDSTHHVIGFVIPSFSQLIRQESFFNLRVRFIRGLISEEQWKIAIQKTDKNHRRWRRMVDILTWYTEAAIDLLLQQQSIEQLVILCNRELTKLIPIYGMDSLKIEADGSVTNVRVSAETMKASIED